MKFTTVDEPDLTLPEDSIHRAKLMELKLKTIEWTVGNEKKSNQILEWWWEITSTRLGPQYVGRRVKGECKPYLSNHDGNRFRSWAEALMNRTLPVGMDIETDDLIGLDAEIVIGHRPGKGDKVWETVSDVIGLDPTMGGTYSQPPF